MKAVMYMHGLVIGKFYPPHLGHEHLIRTAAAQCRQLTVCVLGSSVESLSMEQRVEWLRDSLKDISHIRIVSELDDAPIDYDSPEIWLEHVAAMRRAIGRADCEFGAGPPVDVVFTSEPYGDELAKHFTAAHICVDQCRNRYPVSGTAVRADPCRHWDYLSPAVQAGLALRVVIVGAESTGTTTLSRDLANALRARGGIWVRTGWVAEYGREYSAHLLASTRASDGLAQASDIVWQSEDFRRIAAEQCRREQAAARQGSPVLVCDTDAFATCLWHERYMGHSDERVAAIAATMPPRALYLLTSERGVAFEDDGLRDGEYLRGWMNQRFRSLLATQATPWIELRGSPVVRCEAALAAVDALITKTLRFTPSLEQRQRGPNGLTPP